MQTDSTYLVEEKYSFLDLVDADLLREMFEHFSEATGIAIGITSFPHQELLVCTSWQDICTKFHRAYPESEVHCKRSNIAITSDLNEPKTINIRCCDNGIIDGATPIIIDGVHVADLFAGQVLFEEPDIESFRNRAENYGYDTDAYLEVLKQVPIISEQVFRKEMLFLSEIAVMLGEQGLSNLRMNVAAEHAKESEDRYRRLTENAKDMIYRMALPSGLYEYVSPAALEIFGYTPEEFYETPPLIFKVMHPDFKEYLEENWGKLLEGIMPPSYEYKIIHKSKKERWIHQRNTGIRDEEGTLIAIEGIVTDITHRKKTEEALEQEAAFQSVLSDIASDFITTPLASIDQGINRALEKIGSFVDADRSYIIKFDFAEGTLTNTHEWCKEGVEPQIEHIQEQPIRLFKWAIDKLVELQSVHIPKVNDLPEEAKTLKDEFEAENIQSLLLVPLVSEGKCIGTIGFDFVVEERECSESDTKLLKLAGATLSNALDRKQAEKNLRESEQQLSTLFASMSEMVVIHDVILDDQEQPVNYLITDCNKAFTETTGISREAAVGKLASEVYKAEPPPYLEEFCRVGITGRPYTFATYYEPMGKHFVISAIPLGKDKFATVTTDITAIKEAEDELKKAQNYLSNIINSMPSILIGVDTNGVVTQWNRKAEQQTGITASEAVAQSLSQVFPRLANEIDWITEAMERHEAQMKTHLPWQENEDLRYENITVYPLSLNGAVIRIDDVTEHVRLEEMIIQSEKMLSVGGLAAGMAHEINNPLAGMMQTSDVLTRRLTDLDMPANKKAAEDAGVTMESLRSFMEARNIIDMLDNITSSGKRAAEIVTNMLSLVRKNSTASALHNLAELLDKCVDLAGSDYDLKKKFDFREIEIIREYQEQLPPVACESAKIQQVMLNILRNGAEAMQEEKVEKPRFLLRAELEETTNRVCIEIQDNGPGMTEEVRKRVFEPFFTTKPPDTGTGLGLSVSYFIITENHQGEMIVRSSPGEGAAFIIKLPAERIGR